MMSCNMGKVCNKHITRKIIYAGCVKLNATIKVRRNNFYSQNSIFNGNTFCSRK